MSVLVVEDSGRGGSPALNDDAGAENNGTGAAEFTLDPNVCRVSEDVIGGVVFEVASEVGGVGIVGAETEGV